MGVGVVAFVAEGAEVVVAVVVPVSDVVDFEAFGGSALGASVSVSGEDPFPYGGPVVGEFLAAGAACPWLGRVLCASWGAR